ncbi:MAG: DUF6599 family protein [Thermodesulfobacteriota bacterium]
MAVKLTKGLGAGLLLLFFMLAGPALVLAADLNAYLPPPAESKDWRPDGPAQEVAGQDLFQLINGGAEFYLKHGCQRALAQSYRNEHGKRINLEIFEMRTPDDAQAVFAQKAAGRGEKLDLGHEARLEDYYLNCRKGRMLITLTGFDGESETRTGLVDLARAVAGRIND